MTDEEGRNWNALSALVRGGVSVAQCLTTSDAHFVVHVLWQRGIRSGILVPSDKMDPRLPQIRVAPDPEEADQI